ncbi:MAG: hypothetical protein IKB64_09900 [Paludibacteraceae bacterium]|nr:hypothetical protein [Paludibacteraceae bacterium]
MKITKPRANQILLEAEELKGFDLKVKTKTGLNDSKFNDEYEATILLYRFPGMDASKQFLMGTEASLYTILASTFQNLLDRKVFSEKILLDLVNEVIKSHRRMK